MDDDRGRSLQAPHDPTHPPAFAGSPSPHQSSRLPFPCAATARLLALDDRCSPTVEVDGAPVHARSTVALSAEHVGRDVAVLFDAGRVDRPIVVGVLEGESAHGQVAVSFDGSRLVLSAARELTLQCGSASITLTSDGSVAIRGRRLLSRSSGLHRIMGGSVKIN